MSPLPPLNSDGDMANLPSQPSLGSSGQTPNGATPGTAATPANQPAASAGTDATRTPSAAVRRGSDLFRTPNAGITPRRSNPTRPDLGYYRPMPQITMSSPLPQVTSLVYQENAFTTVFAYPYVCACRCRPPERVDRELARSHSLTPAALGSAPRACQYTCC